MLMKELYEVIPQLTKCWWQNFVSLYHNKLVLWETVLMGIRHTYMDHFLSQSWRKISEQKVGINVACPFLTAHIFSTARK
jgi:hypothetical protein